MTFVMLLPVVLSLLVLGAHFLRSGTFLLVAAVLALIGCLAARRMWVPRLVTGVLLLGSIVWVWTLVMFSRERIQAGEPYLRLVLILGGVALFTALSSLVFRSGRLRAFYRRDRGTPS